MDDSDVSMKSGDLLTTPKGRALAQPTDIAHLSMLSFAIELQSRYEAETSAADRKKRGQFFTPASVAAFMARLFSDFPKRLKVLDAGAGTGTLAAAVCERIVRLRSPRHLELVLYETDPDAVTLLHKNLEHCRSGLQRAQHRMTYTVHHEDFILANPQVFEQRSLFDAPNRLDEFDAVIMNPPYFKIPKSSEYAQRMARVVHGQPNIYALFMAVAAELLRPGGEFVAITPRSFCNGLYFRGFRRWFFQRMSLRHLHLFESRKETFRGANVLQESVITFTTRSSKPPATVRMSTSYAADLHRQPSARQMPTSKVVDNAHGNMVIRIPENAKDERVMELVEAWPKTFTDQGLRVSTGPVVMFRATEFLLDSAAGRNVAPLLSVHNVQRFDTVWPVDKNGKPIAFRVCTESLKRRLLLPVRNYVLLRRFSAKEERRRLTASCLVKENQAGPYVALENHLNYVYHGDRELTDSEMFGLAALFNSALLDRYFRTISGNTQVNASELRTMSFPDLKTLSRIGRRVLPLRDYTESEVEHIVLDELGVHGGLHRYLTELAG